MKTPAVTMVAAWMRRGDRRGAFHGIGQPDMERELRGLADCAGKQQEADQRHDGDVPCSAERAEHVHRSRRRPRRACAKTAAKSSVPNVYHTRKQAEDKAEVPDPIDKKRFRRRGTGAGPLIPVADQ